MKKRKRVTCTVEVQPRKGYSIDAWMDTHQKWKSVREGVRVVGKPRQTAANTYLVDVTYEAQGADASDIMRPYQDTQEWRRIANVVRKSTKYTRPRGVDLAS
jgi:hypothetical protein